MKVRPIRKDLADHFRTQEARIAQLEKQAGITDNNPWKLTEPEWPEVETIMDNIAVLALRYGISAKEYRRIFAR